MGQSLGLFTLLAAGVWIVALIDTVLRGTLDPVGRILLGSLLLLLPPIGLFAWLVIKRHQHRVRRAG